MVIPYTRGSTWEQPPPDLASHLSKNRIIYSGMSLVPSVTELILAEFLYLQYEDEEKPIYLYMKPHWDNKGQVFINVFPHVKQFMDGKRLVYETESMTPWGHKTLCPSLYVKLPIFTLCEGNAWGEAALILAAGSKGYHSALPSSTVMMMQPIGRFQGQVTDVDIARKVKNVKAELVINWSTILLSMLENHPSKLKPTRVAQNILVQPRLLNIGIIDKVIYNEESTEDRGVVSDLKKAHRNVKAPTFSTPLRHSRVLALHLELPRLRHCFQA